MVNNSERISRDWNDGKNSSLRLGALDRRQIMAWRRMGPARRLDLAFQAYQFALDVVRLSERRFHPRLGPEELAWRVTRRMQGNLNLGR
jgi:hypothetical protein